LQLIERVNYKKCSYNSSSGNGGTLLGRLTNNTTTHPIARGMLAINPKRSDSSIVLDGIAGSHFFILVFYFLLIHVIGPLISAG
jgi:hypothetical protein